jgi:hypothetical protein
MSRPVNFFTKIVSVLAEEETYFSILTVALPLKVRLES